MATNPARGDSMGGGVPGGGAVGRGRLTAKSVGPQNTAKISSTVKVMRPSMENKNPKITKQVSIAKQEADRINNARTSTDNHSKNVNPIYSFIRGKSK